jgi:hypothetical protein
MRERRLRQMEQEVTELWIAKALALARTQPPEAFAQTLLDALPPGKWPNSIQIDLDQLRTGELWLLAGIDPSTWSREDLLRLATEEAPAQAREGDEPRTSALPQRLMRDRR